MQEWIFESGNSLSTSHTMMPGVVIMVRLFFVNPNADQKKVIVDWNYNAWGGKYPPHDLDEVILYSHCNQYKIHGLLSRYHHGRRFGRVQRQRNIDDIHACLLNPNRQSAFESATD
jgi:agmatine/peptidylarginine deiminase